MNLMQGLMEELERNRILLQQYREIGQPGTFGATMIQKDIEEAEEAIGENDIVKMVVCCKKLQENK